MSALHTAGERFQGIGHFVNVADGQGFVGGKLADDAVYMQHGGVRDLAGAENIIERVHQARAREVVRPCLVYTR